MAAAQPAAGRGSGPADDALWGLAGLLRDRAELHLLLEQAHALRLVAERVREVRGADAGFVGRVEPDGTMVVRHWSGTLGTSLHDLVVPAGLGVGGKGPSLHAAAGRRRLPGCSLNHPSLRRARPKRGSA